MKKLSLLTALFLLAAPAFAEDAQWLHTVNVTGEAEAKLAPDEATISITIYTENKDLAAAKAANDKQVKTLLTLANEAGVKKENIKTLYASVQPQYDYPEPGNKPVFRTYAVSNQVDVKITTLESLGSFMNTLVKNGFDRINNVQFRLADEKKVREDILVKALQNAQGKAAKLAAAAGRELGRVVYISDAGGGITPPPYPMMQRPMMMKAQAVDASMEAGSVPAGLISVQQNVSVAFELK